MLSGISILLFAFCWIYDRQDKEFSLCIRFSKWYGIKKRANLAYVNSNKNHFHWQQSEHIPLHINKLINHKGNEIFDFSLWTSFVKLLYFFVKCENKSNSILKLKLKCQNTFYFPLLLFQWLQAFSIYHAKFVSISVSLAYIHTISQTAVLWICTKLCSL